MLGQFAGSFLADEIAHAQDDDKESKSDGDVEEISPSGIFLVGAQQVNAVVNIQQDRQQGLHPRGTRAIPAR